MRMEAVVRSPRAFSRNRSKDCSVVMVCIKRTLLSKVIRLSACRASRGVSSAGSRWDTAFKVVSARSAPTPLASRKASKSRSLQYTVSYRRCFWGVMSASLEKIISRLSERE